MTPSKQVTKRYKRSEGYFTLDFATLNQFIDIDSKIILLFLSTKTVPLRWVLLVDTVSETSGLKSPFTALTSQQAYDMFQCLKCNTNFDKTISSH